MIRATCPDARRLQTLLDGGAGEEADDMAHHLESCDDCQRTLELLAAEPTVWHDTQRLHEPRLAEPALQHAVEQLKNEDLFVGEEPDLSFLSAAEHPELLGILGSYEVQQEIGRGGMGIVLKALDPVLNRTVAIKVLSPSLASSVKARQRFLREGRAAAAVAHENIVPVYCVSEAACVPYLVMQFVAGESLQDRLDRGEPLELADIVRIGQQTAAGLAAAHAKGLIHRDIKPANLLLEKGGTRVMITDFGLARTVDDVQVTQAGVVTGTPEFMAPEQARGEPIDHRADLFSLGSVLYALCTGVPPFRGSTTMGVLRQVSDETPNALRSLNPLAPSWLEQFIGRLMQKNAADRIQNAAEAAALLEGYLAHLRQPATVPSPVLTPCRLADGPKSRWARVRRECRRHPRCAALGLVAALILAVWFVRWFGSFQAQLPPEPKAFAGKFYQDFRGSKTPPVYARPMGMDAGAVARPEEEGFRVTLPAQQEPRIRVGLELLPNVKGDFEITFSYEIIRRDPPSTGEGVGVELYVGTSPMLDGLGVLRLTRVTEGDVYMISRSSNRDGKLKFKHTFVPTVATSGRLRLTRNGAEVTAWAAEGQADEFRELCRYDLGPEDVSVIWLTAYAGGSQHGVDVRIIDLNIAADSVTADQVAPPSDPGAGLTGPRGWTAAYVLIGLIVAMACFGLWRHLRRAAAVGARAVGATPSAVELLPIACPGCAKALRVKAALAEKRVRCPHCGQTFQVPRAENKSVETKKSNWSARNIALAITGALAAGALIVAVLIWPESPPVKAFIDTLLGPEAVPDVRESGFHIPEQFQGRAFRWTNGHARLTIPIDPNDRPEALAVDLFAFRPKQIKQVRLQITANGRDLFHQTIDVPPWSWQRTFDLREIDLGKEVVLDIVSDSFVPNSIDTEQEDPRTLGVQVMGIMLLRNEHKPAEADE